MTRSDEDPEGDGAEGQETETAEEAAADPAAETPEETETAEKPESESAEETETETAEDPGSETAAEAETETATEPSDSPDEKIPLSELREEVEPGTDGLSDVSELFTDTDPGEPAQEASRGEGMPLSELRDDVVDGAAAPESESGLFHEERVTEVEAEAVWADLLMGSGDTEAIFDPTAVEAELGREYQVVPKTLCHRCEFFGDPPTLHCTHEGTTIHETVDMDHYRVSECPMVRSDHDSGDE